MSQPLKSGQIFEKRYEILGVLGAGGIGTVYRARQMDVERIVALKILHAHFAHDEELEARFLREAKMLSELSHANIVTIYHLGVAATGEPYLSMELIAGQSGRELLIELGRLPCLRALKIVRDAARALDYVHRHGIVHRDLKPENMILTNEADIDSVKLIDFGLARVTDNDNQKLTQTGELLGTASYMSPEQCKGTKADGRSDIYSLAICLYEFLTGQKCYNDDTAVGVMYKHLNVPAPTIMPVMVDRFTPSLNKLISKSMEKDPELRFQTMADMSQAIDLLIEEVEGTFPTRRSYFGLALPVTCILALLGLSLVLGLHLYRNAAIKQPIIHLHQAVKAKTLESPETVHIPLSNYDLTVLEMRYDRALGPEASITLLKRWEKIHARKASLIDRSVVCASLVSAYASAGQQENAKRSFSRLLASNSGNSGNYSISTATAALAMSYADSAHASEGIELCEEIRKKYPDLNANKNILHTEGKLYEATGDFKRAVTLYKQIPLMFSANPDFDDNEFRESLICALCRLGHTSELPGLIKVCALAIHNSLAQRSDNASLTLSGSRTLERNQPDAVSVAEASRLHHEIYSVATIYRTTAQFLYEGGFREESVEYLQKAKTLYKQVSSTKGLISCFQSTMNDSLNVSDYKTIRALLTEVKEELKQNLELDDKASILLILSKLATGLKDKQLSIDYAQQSVLYCSELYEAKKGQLDIPQSDQCAVSVANLVDLLMKDDKFSQVGEQLKRWIPRVEKQSPDNCVLLWERRRELLFFHGRVDDALACAQEELRLLQNPQTISRARERKLVLTGPLIFAYLIQASCLQRLSRPAEANEAISRARKILDEDRSLSAVDQVNLLLALTSILDKMGKSNEADKYIARIEGLLAHLQSSHNWEFMRRLAELKRDRKDFKAAETLERKCLELLTLDKDLAKPDLVRSVQKDLAETVRARKEAEAAFESNSMHKQNN